MKTFHFLAGLPRSGSTVLSALLNQHPDVHASATSGLCELMVSTFQTWKNSDAEQSSTSVLQIKSVLKSMMDARYEHVDKPVIIDKSRSWAEIASLNALSDLLGRRPKIVVTVRNVEDCAASFVRVAKPNNVEDFLRNDTLIEHLKMSYKALSEGYAYDKECFLVVEYEKLIEEPQKQLRRVEDFLGLSPVEYDLHHLAETAPKERDEEVWRVPGLHDVKPELKKQHNQDSREVLEHSLYLHRHNHRRLQFYRQP